MKEIMLGNEAVARGAFEAGVKFVSSYPGTPSTEITETIAKYKEIACEWAPNEKVGAEAAIGASIRGARAMTCMKHVGMNVCADPLFTVSYSGVNGGLVFCVADDPGMHSSQNEQDSRNYARAAKVPMLEPADSMECKEFARYAFELSEKYDTPVILRLHTRVSHSRSIVHLGEPAPITVKEYVKDPKKYVMMPANAIGKHVVVEDRTRKIINDCDADLKVGMHQLEIRNKKIGIITSGAAYQYVRDAIPDASVLKLGMVWPLPEKTIKEFAAKVERLVVVEELDPFLETEIKALGVKCEGKELFTLQGEYTTRLVQRALTDRPLPVPAFDVTDLPLAPGRPPVLRKEADQPVLPDPGRPVDPEGQRAGKDMAAVVVRVAADQVDPSRREKGADPLTGAAVDRCKIRTEFFCKHKSPRCQTVRLLRVRLPENRSPGSANAFNVILLGKLYKCNL